MRPTREPATSNGQTYMITSSTWERRALFSRDVWAILLIDTLNHYRGTAYLLHEFVVMPDHIHLLLTPMTSLERAVQFVKGGFSYRAKKELGSNLEVWQKGFSDHRIRDASDYRIHQIYVQQNPVRKRLCERAQEYPYSSARAGFDLDPAPQGLKPVTLEEGDTARLEGAPFQSGTSAGTPERGKFENDISGFQSNISSGEPKGAPAQVKIASGRTEMTGTQQKNKTA
jgi:REP-associated tyrosine transposase